MVRGFTPDPAEAEARGEVENALVVFTAVEALEAEKTVRSDCPATAELTVRPRSGEQCSVPVEKFAEMLESARAGRPKRPLNLSTLLGRRPISVG